MNNLEFKSLLAGSEDERLIWDLFYSIRTPRNEIQRVFYLALLAATLLGGDGFEMLLEQNTSLDEYAMAFTEIGMPEIQPIFDKVARLFPKEMLLGPKDVAFFDRVHSSFDELKKLLNEYYDASEDIDAIASKYVRDHQGEFVEFINDDQQ